MIGTYVIIFVTVCRCHCHGNIEIASTWTLRKSSKKKKKEEEKAENGMEVKFDIYIEKMCKIKNVKALARFEYER